MIINQLHYFLFWLIEFAEYTFDIIKRVMPYFLVARLDDLWIWSPTEYKHSKD